jgi:ubiquinol-cytochrome c reductase cytochrome c1 subunit
MARAHLTRMRTTWLLVLALLAGTALASEGGGEAWRQWKANNDIDSHASLQRGARNFVNYCLGCHSLQYMRYSRVGTDLGITEDQVKANLMFTGQRTFDAIVSSMPAADAEAWFGRAPPDLSLIARARGTDYVFQFLKTFYVDATRASTGVNNLALEGASMPHVLADLQGLQRAVFHLERHVEKGEDGKEVVSQVKVFDRFEQVKPGRFTPAEYDAFVRDTVNFLDYVGEPARAQRQRLGIWVVAFLLVFTGFAYALKLEIWKDVH